MKKIKVLIFLFFVASIVQAQYLDSFWQYPDYRSAHALEAEANTSFHYTGGDDGENKIVILKANAQGDVTWKKIFYGSDYLNDILYIDGTNELFVSTVKGHRNFIIKLNPATGDSIWRIRFPNNNLTNPLLIKLWGENSLQALVHYDNNKVAFYSINKMDGTINFYQENFDIPYLDGNHLQRQSDTLYYVRNNNWWFYKFGPTGVVDSVRMSINIHLLDKIDNHRYLFLQDRSMPTEVPKLFIADKFGGNIEKTWNIFNSHDSLNGSIISWVKTANYGWLFAGAGGSTNPDGTTKAPHLYHSQYHMETGSLLWDTVFPTLTYYPQVINGKNNNLICRGSANYSPGYHKINMAHLNEVVSVNKLEYTPFFKVNAFPVPSLGVVELSGSEILKKITVYDLSGNKIQQRFVNARSVPLNIVTKGVYILKIENINGQTVSKKIIIN